MSTERFSSRNLRGASEEKPQWLTRLVTAGLFCVLAVTAFLPVLRIGEYTAGLFGAGKALRRAMEHISTAGDAVDSVLDMLSQFGDLGDVQAGADEFFTELNRYIAALTAMLIVIGILSALIPLVSGALMLLSRGEMAAGIGGAGWVICGLLKLLVHFRIASVNAQIESVNLGGISMADYIRIEWNTGPMVFWIALMVLIAAGIGWYLAQGRMLHTKQRTFSQKERIIIDAPQRKGRERVMQGGFYGAIIGESGSFRDQAYPLVRGEKVVFGRDIPVAGADAGVAEDWCAVSYDEAGEEYRLEPCQSGAVYLGSGQPLGKGRTYCVPRGTQIRILNADNRFTLG